jgi:hypothetical protein
MPTVLIDVFSRKYFFFSNENDEPPHIHVKQAERSAKYWIENPIRQDYNHKFRGSEIRDIERTIEMNRELIMEKWNEYQNKRKS